ncbi:SDR family NAD(P)-dependent oxidoreductase [Alteromonas stellipolaris]|uniref:SDR family NAD(P)-dependent oxidoreductase n=1 Tax=Alteromonas stellipolaris TaxID=233316 RepID=UPI0026E4718C|nr:SDR family oxidoreductase [Alteromonas stellipolaris]MDO6536529.1 SDR family oxidoreductase [Alteromonas stellipolaris]MDO6625920.1 SDR family oxidoreductase [Alteromonas stellipolaris]
MQQPTSNKKLVIVTGASRGLGLAICHLLAADNYQVVAISRASSDALDALCSGNDVTHIPFDLGNLDSLHELTKSIVKTHGRPYALINNAAVGFDGVLATMHNSEINMLLNVNVQAPILLTKYLSRAMLLNRTGRIINISSIIANTGFNGLSVYAASKAALEGFTRSLAREVGKAGITVNCVAPGYMQTDMTDSLTGDKLEAVKRRSPLGTLATPEDAAGAVLYLLSDSAKSITGTTITVDAGSTA